MVVASSLEPRRTTFRCVAGVDVANSVFDGLWQGYGILHSRRKHESMVNRLVDSVILSISRNVLKQLARW
jgi:hypothetical protein